LHFGFQAFKNEIEGISDSCEGVYRDSRRQNRNINMCTCEERILEQPSKLVLNNKN